VRVAPYEMEFHSASPSLLVVSAHPGPGVSIIEVDVWVGAGTDNIRQTLLLAAA